MPASSKRDTKRDFSGRLRIGNDWNAIHIIALSQSNPLKAVAEFVENSIDAQARRITIVRGREAGQSYLKIIDDGSGVPRDAEGRPDFQHVATHICDSLKRQMKAQGAAGIQGEFGIGLLSFWTVGESLSLVSSGADGRSYELRMVKGNPQYTITPLRRLLAQPGVELTIRPLLAGIRQFTGEKLQWYLASELRDRIRHTNVEIVILDRQARAEFRVEPRPFSGQLLRGLPSPSTQFGDAYVELYSAEPCPENRVGLYRAGTRVLADLGELAELAREPWTSGFIQGLIDAPFLNVTPGTRQGIVHDERFAEFDAALAALESQLLDIIRQQQRAAEERTNRDTLKTIQRAFREALLALPQEEYDWFGGNGRKQAPGSSARPGALGSLRPTVQDADAALPELTGTSEPPAQLEFFEHPGPLHGVRITPASCVMSVNTSRKFRAVARDRGGRELGDDVAFEWRVVEGQAELTAEQGEIAGITAPGEPQLLKIAVIARQGERQAAAEGLITVTDSLTPERPRGDSQQGLPEYTFEKRPGDLWRSRLDTSQNLIVVNNGHRDFVYASRSKALQLRYICRLFAKELVLHNFPGYNAPQLLERMIELSLYTEDHLR